MNPHEKVNILRHLCDLKKRVGDMYLELIETQLDISNIFEREELLQELADFEVGNLFKTAPDLPTPPRMAPGGRKGTG